MIIFVAYHQPSSFILSFATLLQHGAIILIKDRLQSGKKKFKWQLWNQWSCLITRPLHHGKFCSHLPSLKQYIIIVNVHVLSTNSVEVKFFGLKFFKKTESFLALFAKLCFLLLTIRVNGMIEPRYLPSNPLLDLRSTYASQLPSYS